MHPCSQRALGNSWRVCHSGLAAELARAVSDLLSDFEQIRFGSIGFAETFHELADGARQLSFCGPRSWRLDEFRAIALNMLNNGFFLFAVFVHERNSDVSAAQ